jgi:uncharacterized tellurite resistance protein B-like protein
MNEFDQLEDFTLFLFLHMARADGSVHPNEKETIHEKMKEIFKVETIAPSKWMAMESLHEKSGQEASEVFLKNNWLRFTQADPDLKKKIYEALFDILNANGRVDSGEMQTLKSVRSWLL